MTNADEQSEHNHTGVKLEIVRQRQVHGTGFFVLRQRQNINEANLVHYDVFITHLNNNKFTNVASNTPHCLI